MPRRARRPCTDRPRGPALRDRGPRRRPPVRRRARSSRPRRSSTRSCTAAASARCPPSPERSSAPPTAPPQLPPRACYVEGFAGYEALGDRIAAAHTTARPAPSAAATESTPAGEEGGNPHIWFLLDRSGSMGSIAADVVDGFERFFASQREQSGGGRRDHRAVRQRPGPHDVIVDARPIGEVPSIRDRFQPRGMTPLYDAIGGLLDRAEAAGGVAADQLVVDHDRRRRERQPQVGPARAVRPHRLAARAGLDLRVPRRQPGQLRWRAHSSTSAPATSATSHRARPACRRPTTGCPARSARGGRGRGPSASASGTTSGVA